LASSFGIGIIIPVSGQLLCMFLLSAGWLAVRNANANATATATTDSVANETAISAPQVLANFKSFSARLALLSFHTRKNYLPIRAE